MIEHVKREKENGRLERLTVRQNDEYEKVDANVE